MKGNETIDKYKARFVVKGFTTILLDSSW
jgi:hypothetical protein